MGHWGLPQTQGAPQKGRVGLGGFPRNAKHSYLRRNFHATLYISDDIPSRATTPPFPIPHFIFCCHFGCGGTHLSPLGHFPGDLRLVYISDLVKYFIQYFIILFGADELSEIASFSDFLAGFSRIS